MTAQGSTGGDPGKLSTTGGTMSGPLLLEDGSPAASEQYVADHAGGGGGGSGTVTSVNGIEPDGDGAVVLVPANVGADAAGDAADAQAYAIQRGHHTGTQLAATISDFGSAAIAAVPIVDPYATALDLVAQTVDPAVATATASLGAGLLVLVLTPFPAGPVASLSTWLHLAASGSSGVSGLALYTKVGVLIDQTADMTAAFSAGNDAHIAGLLGATQDIAADAYYLGALTHFGTAPVIMATPGTTVNLPPINGRRRSIYFTNTSAFPSSFDPAAGNLNSGVYWMGGAA